MIRRVLYCVLFIPSISVFVLVMICVLWAINVKWLLTGKWEHEWFYDLMDWFMERSLLAKLQD